MSTTRLCVAFNLAVCVLSKLDGVTSIFIRFVRRAKKIYRTFIKHDVSFTFAGQYSQMKVDF